MAERLFTAFEIAGMLEATPSTVLEWVRMGWLPTRRVSDGPLKVTEQALLQFLHHRGVDIERFVNDGTVIAAATAVANDEPFSVVSAASKSSDEIQPLPSQPPVTTDDEPSPLQRRMLLGGKPFDENDSMDHESSVEDLEPPDIPPSPSPEISSPPPTCQASPVEPPAAAPPPDAARQIALAVVEDAVALGAEAIYLDAVATGLSLRLRLAGAIQEKPNFGSRLPHGISGRLIEEFKMLARSSAGEGRPLSVVSLPTAHGESLAITISRQYRRLTDLNLQGPPLASLQSLARCRSGLIILCNPSLADTAELLRALSLEAADPHRRLVTVERRISHALPGALQCHAKAHDEWRYASLAASARQAGADIAMIEEIREPSDAAAALDAAEEGALVLASLRAPTAAAAAAVLLDMGLAPWPLSLSLLAIIESQPVKALCPHCRRVVPPNSPLAEPLRTMLPAREGPFYSPGGCEQCGGAGFAGRVTLCNLWHAQDGLSQAIRRATTAEAVAQVAAEAGCGAFLHTAVALAVHGDIGIEELVSLLARQPSARP